MILSFYIFILFWKRRFEVDRRHDDKENKMNCKYIIIELYAMTKITKNDDNESVADESRSNDEMNWDFFALKCINGHG